MTVKALDASVPAQPATDALLFYQPILLDKALVSAIKAQQEGFYDSSNGGGGALQSDQQLFYTFVNKLCQVCDNERGGKTVTSISITSNLGIPKYILGSNRRTLDQLSNTREFLTSLLSYIANNRPDKNDKTKFKAINKQVLWRILEFGFPRVKAYLVNLKKYVNLCIEDCENRSENLKGKKDLSTISSLNSLY